MRDMRRTVQPVTEFNEGENVTPSWKTEKKFSPSPLHLRTVITNYSSSQHTACTHVSCVPKKKIGILFGGGFTAPSATSSICKQTRRSGEKGQ